jgi:hypothetical protein
MPTPNRCSWPGGWNVEREGRSCPDSRGMRTRCGLVGVWTGGIRQWCPSRFRLDRSLARQMPSEPPWGFEPQTYALRAFECEMVVDGQSGPVLNPASESTANAGVLDLGWIDGRRRHRWSTDVPKPRPVRSSTKPSRRRGEGSTWPPTAQLLGVAGHKPAGGTRPSTSCGIPPHRPMRLRQRTDPDA